jgi:glycoprotein-N-acetylgalactosamine 3-beta-galactosyltransferase
MRNAQRLGLAGSRDVGAEKAFSDGASAVVFLENNARFSSKWLTYLLGTLADYPEGIVFPAYDVIDPLTGTILAGDDAVGAVDARLDFVWDIPDAGSIPLVKEWRGSHDLLLSPVAPPAHAMTAKFFRDIGGAGLSSTELSFRAWLCGGSVIREPCARMALVYENLHSEAYVPGGVTEFDEDKEALSVAHAWMGRDNAESVRKARFLHKAPYVLEVPENAPSFMFNAKQDRKCSDFEWYLDNVYPPLREMLVEVNEKWTDEAAQERYLKAVDKLVKQYQKKTNLSDLQHAELDRVREEQHKRQEQFHNRNNDPAKNKDEEAKAAKHVQQVKDGLCEDFKQEECRVQAAKGDCVLNPGYMIFHCPKACELCDAKGKLCVDFYLKKCPEWALEGQCDSNQEFAHYNCRESCKLCTPAVGGAVVAGKETKPAKPTAPAWSDSMLGELPAIDPYIVKQDYTAGNVPEILEGTCKLSANDKTLLATMKDVQEFPRALQRLMCIVYTTVEKHETSVRAIRETWGKRCDGFVVLSTTEDKSIPAVNLLHEGVEEYNNIWQKVRAGWAYIAKHYKSEFDWFYIGGDDVFMLVEAMKAYLSSDEISRATDSGRKPIFLGRRFRLPDGSIFNSGGAGYVLNRKALALLEPLLRTCLPHQVAFHEDVNVAKCLREHANVEPFDTRDVAGRERFHPFTPGHHLSYRIPTDPMNKDWYPKYTIDLKEGLDCCAPDSVTFHYVSADLMRSIYSYMYLGGCH